MFNLRTVKKTNEASKKLFAAIRSNKHERKRQQKISKTNAVIDLDSSKAPTEISSSSAWWIEALYLQDLERELIASGSWINAPIINASQHILSIQFNRELQGAGFQDVGCGLTMSFSVETFFIQILHDLDRNHWLTISNIGNDQPENIYVYDSMFSYSSAYPRD